MSGSRILAARLQSLQQAPSGAPAVDYSRLRRLAQERVLAEVDPALLGRHRDPEARAAVKAAALKAVDAELPLLAREERERLAERLARDIHGYGPLDPLLDDPEVTDILIYRHDRIRVIRDGRREEVPARFEDEAHLGLVLERILAPLGRRLDAASPVADARLPDGARVNAVLGGVAVDGTTVAIRKFRPDVGMERLVAWGMLPPGLARWLGACVRGGLNLVVSGATGSGKTTLLNALTAFIPPEEDLILIENPAEMQPRHPYVRRLEARPPNAEGKGAVTMLALVEASLRMCPTRIIVGECRGAETFAMLQAMNTGHLGSMTTVHANSPALALQRLAAMATAAGVVPGELVPSYVGAAVELVVQAAQFKDGRRHVTEVGEVRPDPEAGWRYRPLVRFQPRGVGPDGSVLGAWVPETGCALDPELGERLRARGVALPPLTREEFDPARPARWEGGEGDGA